MNMKTDITLQEAGMNKEEHTLFTHEQQLNLIYNSAIDSMWLIGVEPGNNFRFESVNESFKIITGYTDEQVLGKLIEDVMPPSSHDLVRSKYSQAVTTGELVDYIEVAPLPAGKRVGEIRVIPVKNKYGQVTKLVCIANDITARRAAEEQNRLYEMKLAKAIINAQEQERLQIGQELHDNVNQILAGAMLRLGLSKELPVERTAEFIDKARDYIADAIGEIRSLSHRLSPVAFDNISFKSAVEELVKNINIQQQYKVNLSFDNFSFNNENEIKLNLYRILQEQLINIVKYAEATILQITFAKTNDHVTLTILDNGKGFDPATERKGIGLKNIKMRAESFDGNFSLVSHPGQGCTIIVQIPLLK